ncbi:hypothetical protein HDK77DRAFT_81376 [Phyllosticta capitalensis]
MAASRTRRPPDLYSHHPHGITGSSGAGVQSPVQPDEHCDRDGDGHPTGKDDKLTWKAICLHCEQRQQCSHWRLCQKNCGECHTRDHQGVSCPKRDFTTWYHRHGDATIDQKTQNEHHVGELEDAAAYYTSGLQSTQGQLQEQRQACNADDLAHGRSREDVYRGHCQRDGHERGRARSCPPLATRPSIIDTPLDLRSTNQGSDGIWAIFDRLERDNLDMRSDIQFLAYCIQNLRRDMNHQHQQNASQIRMNGIIAGCVCNNYAHILTLRGLITSARNQPRRAQRASEPTEQYQPVELE